MSGAADFAHRLPLDRIRDGERIELSADEAERAAVASRARLVSLDRLDAHVALARDGAAISATGRVRARLQQACVATGEPVPAAIDEPFALRFLPEPGGRAGDDELELGAGDLDTMFHDGAGIDLGAAIIDTLVLALDPYPRSPGAAVALKQAGVIGEDEAGPFAALGALKARMSGEA